MTLTAELGSLSGLESLNLDYNQLSDGIPTELGNLTNLRTLGIAVNGRAAGGAGQPLEPEVPVPVLQPADGQYSSDLGQPRQSAALLPEQATV